MNDSTRKIVAFDRVSADGYFSAEDGGLNWAMPDPELDKAAVDRTPGGNTILFGRRTYDMFEKFWPHALDDSPTSPDPHAAGRRTPEMRAMAVWINDAQKLVFSKTRRDVTWKNSKLLHELDVQNIEALKRQPGKDMMIFGSGSVVSQLTERGLIDEYRLCRQSRAPRQGALAHRRRHQERVAGAPGGQTDQGRQRAAAIRPPTLAVDHRDAGHRDRSHDRP